MPSYLSIRSTLIVALATALFALAQPAQAADVCYQLPFSNPNLADGFGATAGRPNPHRGVDFPQASGTPVPSVADGTVVNWTWSSCLGNVMVVKHPDGWYSGYSHLSAKLVSPGAKVSKGQHIARVGNTGTCTTGPHLHLTMSPYDYGWGYGKVVDPYAYIQARKNCDCDRTAKTSHTGSLTFSCDGANKSGYCTKVNEPADSNTWHDNYMCTSWDHQAQWSHAGMIDGMDCTQVAESSSKFSSAWSDNYWCVPHNSFARFTWSSAGKKAGWDCVHWNEPNSQSDSFSDNYLCARPRTDYSNGFFTFSSNGPNDDQVCVSVAEPLDPDGWDDNYICTPEDVGLAWSTQGPIQGMRCLEVTEVKANEGQGWDDNHLCLPEDSPYELSWSNHEVEDPTGCFRFAELGDPNGSWRDNWVCVTVREPQGETTDPDGGVESAGDAQGREDGGKNDEEVDNSASGVLRGTPGDDADAPDDAVGGCTLSQVNARSPHHPGLLLLLGLVVGLLVERRHARRGRVKGPNDV